MYNPGTGGYGGGMGGAGAATAAAIILPNTGSHWMLTVLAVTSLVVGLAVCATSIARLVAQRVR